MFRTALLLFVLSSLAIPVLAACGGDDDGLTKVTLMLDWTPNTHHTGFYVARDKGWYREAGLDVEIVEPAEGGVEQVVGAGQVAFGVSVQESVIPARAAGIPIVSIAAIKQHNDSSLLSLSSEGINRPRDLEGKTYGGFGGPLESALIRTLVSCDGGNPDRVKLAEVGNVDYLAGLEANQYDVVWVFEGWDAIRYRQIENKSVMSIKFVDYLRCIPDWYTPLIIANEDTLAKKPDLVRKFLAATARGYDYAISNPSDAGGILAKAVPELDSRLVDLSASYHTTKYMDTGRPWGLQDADVWTSFEQFLRDAGLTDTAVDVSKAYSNEFLPKR